MLRDEIGKLRQNYSQATLHEDAANPNPILQFEEWFAQAAHAHVYEHNAMTLATCSNHEPDARIVLLKSFNEQGFVFFTNYNSAKGKELEANPRAALVFFWKEIERQVRIRGAVKKIPSPISEEYFNSRPLDSQCGAIASAQSNIIASREQLDKQYAHVLAVHQHATPTMPLHWGGYIVEPSAIEFWQGREGRMHDRLLYTKNDSQEWQISRLQP